MPKSSVYIETSIVGYLTAKLSRDLLVAAHQQVTQDWWLRRDRFELVISDAVIEEAARGDPAASARRLQALEGILVLPATTEAQSLAAALLRGAAMPPKAAIDAAHVAIAAVHRVDFLLTWNCAHIANIIIRSKIDSICSAAGFRAPGIATPLELTADEEDQ